MIDASTLHVVISGISMLFLWVLLFWLYQDYRVDRFRDEMFALRDELFDAARRGDISFENPAYGDLRITMNGFIRFGHRMTLLQVLPLILWAESNANAKERKKEFVATFQQHLSELSEPQRQLMVQFQSRMHLIAFRQLILGSAVFSASLVVPLMFVSLSLIAARFLLIKSIAMAVSDHVLRERLDPTAMGVGLSQRA